MLMPLIILLSSCAPEGEPTIAGTRVLTPAATPVLATPASTPMLSRTAGTASALPIGSTITVDTPEAGQLERWRQYEAALAEKLLPYLSLDDVVCEWQVLGQSADEVYVWAACMGTVLVGQVNPGYPRVSIPAVIHLREDGAAHGVDVPGAGTLYAHDIREMFPADVQERIFNDEIEYQRLGEHLLWRIEHPEEPPILVLDATQAP